MKYMYNGPMSGVTFGNGKEILLHPGKEVEIPSRKYADKMVKLGYFIPVEEEKKQPKKKKSNSKNKGVKDAS